MANNNLANVPNFYKGTYANLVKALEPGGLFANQNKAAMAFVTDRHCLAVIDTDGSITLVGDSSSSVQPEQGSVIDPIVLDELNPGVYSISGSYQMSAGQPVISTSANQLFIISEDGSISQMDGSSIKKQEFDSSTGTMVESEYVTDAELIRSLADATDIDSLFS